MTKRGWREILAESIALDKWLEENHEGYRKALEGYRQAREEQDKAEGSEWIKWDRVRLACGDQLVAIRKEMRAKQ